MSTQLVDLLRQTLNPQESRRAEQGLTSAEASPGFTVSLLELVCDATKELAIRQAGALFFKNTIKRNWSVDGGSTNIPEDDRSLIKSGIVRAMTTLPSALQLQVGEAATVIADSDFPKAWPTLIDDLVNNISMTDMSVTNGVLQTAHSIFKRWRAQYRSDALFTEIAFVLSRFCEPFLQLFKQVDSLIGQNEQNPQALNILFETLSLLSKVFYDLNSQDIPEFFEDHMSEFMFVLHKYLGFSNAQLESIADEDMPGPLERTKASICEIAELYTQRYEEIFSMLPEFVNTTWALLTQISQSSRYDVLLGRALSFLTCVVKIQRHASLFQSESVLQQFVEKIVLPNMSLRASDEELFEDDPIEYIRRDLEGGDNDTRRRSATEFVRGLVEQFEQTMTTIVMNYANHYLEQYNQNRATMWASKDTAIYLITSVAIKGVVTRYGVSSTNLTIDIVHVFNEHLLPDLKSPFSAIHPILKLDAIKFVLVFRNQLTIQQLTDVFPVLAQHLNHDNSVVSTYAAITIEALLALRRDNALVFDKATVASVAELLCGNLLQLIERGDSPEKIAENDFLMRCLMRIIVSIQDLVAGPSVMILSHLNKILALVSKNPSNPQFNHYLFECYGAIFRYVNISSASSETLTEPESTAVGPLLAVLQNDVPEFVPYVFQLLAQLIEQRKDSDLPSIYLGLLPPLMTPSLWESRGNIPALVRLIQAFLKQRNSKDHAQQSLEAILGIFQKLLASKANDQFGFELLETIYTCVPAAHLQKYNQLIFQLLLTRLNNSNTEKYTLRFVVFILHIAALDKQAGPDLVVETIDAIQAGLFLQVYKTFVLANAQKIILPIDVKTVSIGMTCFLTKSRALNGEYFQSLWLPTLTSQLKFLELPAQDIKDEDLLAGLDVDETGFQASFVRLRTTARIGRDPWSQIADPKAFFITNLQSLMAQDAKCTEELRKLPADGQAILKSYGLPL